MSHYTTRASASPRNYVVIKHGIPNVNSTVMGVKFRGGWAVVDKGSKTYHSLTKLPMLKNPKEMPLSFLKQLPFITRAMDVKLIYGADVFAKYVTLSEELEVKAEVEQKAQAETEHLNDTTICTYRLSSGNLCKVTVSDAKVSRYCTHHILEDPRLEEIEFKVPKVMVTKQRRKLRKSAFNSLKKSLNERKPNVQLVEEPQSEEETVVEKEA